MNVFNNSNPDISTLKPSILRTTHTSRPLHVFDRIINTGKLIPRYLGCCIGQSQHQQGVNSGLVAFFFLLLSPLDASDHIGVQGNGGNALIFLLPVISCPDRVKIKFVFASGHPCTRLMQWEIFELRRHELLQCDSSHTEVLPKSFQVCPQTEVF